MNQFQHMVNRAMVPFFVCFNMVVLPAFSDEQPVVPVYPKPFVWENAAPSNSPFAQSANYNGLLFSGRYELYERADTFYPSWGADDRLYSPFTDGAVNGLYSRSYSVDFHPDPTIGYVIIDGDDALNLTFSGEGLILGDPSPYLGRYPCGSLMHNGVWYIGTYALGRADYGLNWPILGPCPGFHVSTNAGQSWTVSPLSCAIGDALFPEPTATNAPVKIGAPHFVDFGQNMEHSPDGKAYLISHGSTEMDGADRIANLSWITGDEIYLCRVTPSVQNINDESMYEYYAGTNAQGDAVWSWDFADIEPLYAWDNNCGCVTMTYNAPLGKYMMCVTDGWPTVEEMNTYILLSDHITGPWEMLTYMESFGVQAYFVNIPSKFISEDGETFWLCYSANFTGGQNASIPYGSGYNMTMREVTMVDEATWNRYPKAEPLAEPLKAANNLALNATVTASSTYPDPTYSSSSVCDGVVDGYPGDSTKEWASNRQGVGAWARLEWGQAQTVNTVWLFDRPNTYDQVTSAEIEFSDGTSISVSALPDDAKSGLGVTFESKTITWMKVTVTGVKPGSLNIGFAEIGALFIEPDADNDGLPDSWESAFFGGPTNAVVSYDADGDGFDNWSEFVSGYDPTNALSFFSITNFSAEAVNAPSNVVSWASISGRVYAVEWCDHLTNSFIAISGDLPYPAGSYTDAVERLGPYGFYRINVRLTP